MIQESSHIFLVQLSTAELLQITNSAVFKFVRRIKLQVDLKWELQKILKGKNILERHNN